MLINTKPFGEINIDERQRLYFPYGLVGFEHLKDYALMDAKQPPFYWLQSIDVQDLAFIMIDPLLFRPDYQIDVPEEELQEIGVDGPENLLILAIVTVPEEQRKMTANLLGPVLINRAKKIGRQSISRDPRWKTRHLILEELARIKG